MRRKGWKIHKQKQHVWWICEVTNYGCVPRRWYPSGAEAIAAFAAGGR